MHPKEFAGYLGHGWNFIFLSLIGIRESLPRGKKKFTERGENSRLVEVTRWAIRTSLSPKTTTDTYSLPPSALVFTSKQHSASTSAVAQKA